MRDVLLTQRPGKLLFEMFSEEMDQASTCLTLIWSLALEAIEEFSRSECMREAGLENLCCK